MHQRLDYPYAKVEVRQESARYMTRQMVNFRVNVVTKVPEGEATYQVLACVLS